jgi:predicted XRE-type DNA-binding protein
MTDPIMALRRQLAAEIVRSLGPNSHYLLAPRCGIPQPRMSQLSRGKVDRFSIEWLIRRIYRLNGSVAITVTLGDYAAEWARERRVATRARLIAQGIIDPNRHRP